MKEKETIVETTAPTQLDAVVRGQKLIGKLYAQAEVLRKKANLTGLEIGREIIQMCSDNEIIGHITFKNAKENKPFGGTPTRIYSWVSDQLAEPMRYDAGYLKRCAVNYLNALNALRIQNRDKPIELKNGILTPVALNLPTVEQVEPFIKQPDCPRMDDVVPDAVESVPPDENEVIERKINSMLRLFLAPDGTPRVNPKAFKTLVQKIQPIADAHGFAFGKTMHQPVEKH